MCPPHHIIESTPTDRELTLSFSENREEKSRVEFVRKEGVIWLSFLKYDAIIINKNYDEEEDGG